jgi:hypothetical protein
MAMIPDTGKRVAKNTSEDVNQRIRREMQQRVARYRSANPEQIDRRLRELDQEWDTERTLEANAATLAFTGCVLAATVDRRWIYLPMAITAFLFQHAVQGWCPPLPVIRRLGFRTEREIQEERSALQMLRDERQAAESVAASSLGFVAVHLAVDE